MSDTDNEKVGKVIPIELSSEVKKSYMDYAMSVIVARALPDVRDGLKPVHRRILYTMNEDGFTPDKGYRKCATTVGDVLGRYHPHGDASVYDALVRMAQNFSLRYMLIDGHGNFGSVDGDGAAAYRYTEARMSKISMLMLEDIDKNTVDFMPNFDDRLKEPVVLPSKLPALLINGSSGIAVGMATNIPPHNLTEVINGIIKMLESDTEITDEDLMTEIKGPDFPTGAYIVGREGIKEAYKTGKGKITVRAKSEIEEMNNSRQRIIFTEIPYGVNKAKLIETIAMYVRDKKLVGISDLRDESDRDGMRIVVELKRDANANVVLNQLFKFTQLQDTFGVIMLALVNGEPKILTLKEILKCYIKHREEVVVRRTKFDLEKAQARLHILEGLKKALDNIDEVIKIIRNAYDDAKERLMAKFALTEIQAQAILDMKLRTLSGLQREKIDNEYDELIAFVKKCQEILQSETLVYQIIKDELKEVKAKFGDERKTQIIAAEGEFEMEDLIKDEDVVVALTHFGYIKRVPIDTYKSQRRGGKGITAMSTREEDFVEKLFVPSTHSTIMFFTNKGRVYRLKGYEIPEASRIAKGTAIVNLLQLDPGENITAVIPLREFVDGQYLLMMTQKGLVKKTNLMEYANIRKSGLQGIALKDDDELIDVRLTDGNSDLVMVTRNGMSIKFNEKDVRSVGRVSQGVIGMKLSADDIVVGMEIIHDDKDCLLAITENGFGKRTELEEYRHQSRAGKGVITYKVTEKTGKVIGTRIVKDDDEIMLITNGGVVIRMFVKEISILGRSTQGVTLMRTSGEEKVVSIEKLDMGKEYGITDDEE
ncbi:MAG: DNA gyrase subunit A [Clostridia bacterium]|nr:DNA gyrase subunit A [Clostridia bacterium]